MRVVFLGTPDFAVATLDAIYLSKHEVVGIVTAPDKPAGRGLKIQCSEVKKYAVEKNIPLLQPEKLKNQEFIEQIKQWQADIFVVVAFRMLPYEVYNIPPKGTFNVHASLLPQYRGAAPIHWTIMNGETKTGITTFFLNNEIDCGDIILQKEIDILPDETTGELYDRLKKLGAEMAVETLSFIEKGNIIPLPQIQRNSDLIKLAPKIHKEDTIINWNLPAKEIINKIRGLAPYPGAVTLLKKNDGNLVSVKIFEATITPEKSNEISGKIDTDNKSFFYISSKDFKISILNLQFEGKIRINVNDFLHGCNINNYTIFIK
ncbi:MAG: methionyl-tRNA formyltransferase [Lentimicrobiaceae bacterium]|nr:methionyl-tRNA formyltransferase [Lentimicrobiaceae bacterium]